MSIDDVGRHKYATGRSNDGNGGYEDDIKVIDQCPGCRMRVLESALRDALPKDDQYAFGKAMVDACKRVFKK